MTRATILCMLGAYALTWASVAGALTRAQIIATASDYLTVDYTITAQNTYPIAPCYTAATAPYCSHLPVGTWSGEVYGFGLNTFA